MISFDNGVFSLNGEGFSYLFRVTKHRQLEHLHFGVPVSPEDAAALACKTGTGWGCSGYLSGCTAYGMERQWSG